MNLSHVKPWKFESFSVAYRTLLPDYTYRFYNPLFISFPFPHDIAKKIYAVSSTRADDRWNNYVDASEVERIRPFAPFDLKRGVTFRFGVKKEGKGVAEKRDFCILAAIIKNTHLTVFHRSLELSGGIAYDLTLLARLGRELRVKWTRLTLFAWNSEIHSVRSKSGRIGPNEKLFYQLHDSILDAP